MVGPLKEQLDHALDWMEAEIIDKFSPSIVGLKDM